MIIHKLYHKIISLSYKTPGSQRQLSRLAYGGVAPKNVFTAIQKTGADSGDGQAEGRYLAFLAALVAIVIFFG